MIDRVPSVGTMVLSVDRQELGKVKAVSGDCFKVDAPMAIDSWLGVDTILEGDSTIGVGENGVIRLRYRKDGIEEAKQDKPTHGGYHRHT